MSLLYNRFIGGSSIHQAIQTSKHHKWFPIYDYAKEGVKSPSYVEDVTNRIIKDLHIINKEYENHETKPFYALKLSTFLTHPKFIIHINKAISIANTLRIPILFDSENNALHAKEITTTKVLAHTYNQDHSPPTLYKTYQMYRKDALKELEDDLSKPYFKGFKLVRGAYLAKDTGTGALLRSKNLVDYSYDRGIEMVFNRLITHPDVHLLIATHNHHSVNKALSIVHKHDHVHSQVSFAQLKGMADSLTNHIMVNSPCKAYKYVPYGSYTDSMPYLMRRLGENYTILKYIM